MPRIPDCNELFQRFFVPWYDADDFDRLVLGSASGAMARPDLMQLPDYIGKSGSELSPLRKRDQPGCIEHLEAMLDAAVSDFHQCVDLQLPPSLSSIQAIDEFYDTGEIAKLISSSDPTEDGNPYLIMCIELGTLIADMMRSIVPELEWIADSPYWESALWHPRTATLIPPTHWAIKKLSSYGWNDGLVPKIMCGLEPLQSTGIQHNQ